MDDATYDFGAEDESAATPRRPGLPLEPRRLLLILAESRRPLLKALLAGCVVALLASFFLPETYRSTAQLLFEGSPLLDPGSVRTKPDAFVQSAVAPNRLREVRDRLGWDVSLKQLSRMINVTLESGATMLIGGEAGTAEEAHELARAVLAVFLARQAAFNEQKLETLIAENEAALERSKERRDEANAVYDAFREKSGRPDFLREQEQLLARAGELRTRVDAASVEMGAQRARIDELERAQREIPNQIVASATQGSPVDTPLAQARSELAAARASLSEHHPTVQALKQRVASLQAQRKGQRAEISERILAANPARAMVDQQVATAKAALAAATERESALRVLLDANRAEAESLALEEGEARQVLGELELADKRFEELTERAAILQDAVLSQLTGFRVLSVPMLPEESQRSKRHILMLALLPVLTVLIFALGLIATRLRRLTVEAPTEVAWWGNGPVLGTSTWPRDADALEGFVAELEDHGVRGAGRTLVVPASEAEREIACSFAIRLAEAPWLAAGILDIGDRMANDPYGGPLVTPAPGVRAAPSTSVPKQLSAQGTPSVSHGRVVPTIQGFVPPGEAPAASAPVVTPAPSAQGAAPSSSRPPRKKTMIGLPAVGATSATRGSEPATPTPAATRATASTGPEPFRRRRGARASIRMVVPVTNSVTSQATSAARETGVDEEAFLLTRPVPIANDGSPSTSEPPVHMSTDSPGAGASNAVMRAAVRLLGNDDDEITDLRRSDPPSPPVLGGVAGVALAWNGPLSGPLLRRAARLAHRVMVVVSSGMSAVDLARVHTRLGLENGVGYVLVNLSDAYVDLPDRVGPVEEFWEGARAGDANDSGRP